MKWISVKEKLPDKNSRVLVWAHGMPFLMYYDSYKERFTPSRTMCLHADILESDITHYCIITPPNQE